ncbi:hypothetical protein MA16_Dca001565 [Dendrobium catenatum]|uniref:Uncharacterized protein n=1 Tax=Dendrobium catenatum TaxID=906689 RepID=A0A2I0WMR9_9ASPA|nr:hypothetical protein MA16_Dca001565 [Dendrobium catenatum]
MDCSAKREVEEGMEEGVHESERMHESERLVHESESEPNLAENSSGFNISKRLPWIIHNFQCRSWLNYYIFNRDNLFVLLFYICGTSSLVDGCGGGTSCIGGCGRSSLANGRGEGTSCIGGCGRSSLANGGGGGTSSLGCSEGCKAVFFTDWKLEEELDIWDFFGL